MPGNPSPVDQVQQDVPEHANVVSLDDHRAWRDLRIALNGVRFAWVEPPPELLPAVFERLDAIDRARRHGRWVACAGGIAAGAIVFASRRRAS